MSTQFFWGASFGQIYPELRRLERAGLVDVESERRAAAKGLPPDVRRRADAFADWLRGDTDLFQYRDEGLLRLFFGDLTDPAAALENVRRMREWREQVAAFFGDQIAPHAHEDVELGYRFPLRALSFGTAWLEAQAASLATLERELEDELKDR